MKKKIVAILLAASMCLTMGLAGCSGEPSAPAGSSSAPSSSQQESSDPASASEGSAEAEKPSGEVTLWTGTWNETLLDELLNKGYYDEYPDVTVSAEYYPWDGMEDKYMVALQANAVPDVLDVAVAWTIPYAKMGKVQKLNDYFDKYGVDVSDFYDGPMQTLTVDGGYYAIPYRTEAMTMFYNKRLFREAGLDPEDPPETWAEMTEMAKKLTNGDVSGFGLCGTQSGNVTAQIYGNMFSNGVKLLNDDMTKVTFNTPEGVEALEAWSDMFTKERCVPASALENDNTTNRNLFTEEKIAMYISGSYDLDPIKEANPDIEMGFCFVPKLKEYAVQAGGWNICLTTNAQNPEAAFTVMNYLTSTEIGPEFSSTLSSRKSAADNPKYSDPDLEVFIEALQYGTALPGSAKMTAITNVVYNHAQAVLAGTKDAATALADAEAECNELLAE